MKLTASIATPKTDEQLKQQAFAAGLHAWKSGRWPTACPHHPGSLMYEWWMEGYNSQKGFL